MESSEIDAVEKTVSIVMGQANSINFRSKEDQNKKHIVGLEDEEFTGDWTTISVELWI